MIETDWRCTSQLIKNLRRRAFFSSRQHVLVLVLNRIADTRLPEVISLSSVLLTVALANLSRYYVAWGDLNKLLFSPSICASCLFVTDKPTVSVKFIEINSDKAYTSIWSDSDFSQLTMLENEKKVSNTWVALTGRQLIGNFPIISNFSCWQYSLLPLFVSMHLFPPHPTHPP